MSDLSQETLKTEINKELASFKILPKLLILIPLVFLPLFFHDDGSYVLIIALYFYFLVLPVILIIGEIFLIFYAYKVNSLLRTKKVTSLTLNQSSVEKKKVIKTLKFEIILSQWFTVIMSSFYFYFGETLIYYNLVYTGWTSSSVAQGDGTGLMQLFSFYYIIIIALITLPALIFATIVENKLRREFQAFKNLIVLKIILYPLCLITGAIGIYGFLQLWH